MVYDAPTDGLRGAVHDPHQLRAPKLSEEIAADLVRDIVAGGLRIGDHLDPEAVMVDHYGVGRESLREALRLLESQGLITIKRGPGGGPVVAGVDPRYLARTTSLFFHLGGATYDEVLETWQVLEPALVAQVARAPGRAEARRVLSPYLWLPENGGDRDDQGTDAGFHTTLAQLSGSRVMVLLLRALSHMVVDHVAQARCLLGERDEEERQHAAIARLVLDGRPVKAQRLMADHIGEVRASWTRRWPGTGCSTRWGRR